ncbi:hypothetical protein V3C99_001114, partial [Haemonchus contortus]
MRNGSCMITGSVLLRGW